MLGIVGIKLDEGNIQIKQDIPPKGITIDLKVVKISEIKENPNVAEVKFSYLVSYTPNTAAVSLNGTALITDLPQEIERITKSWKDKKRLDGDTGAMILNAINPYITYNSLLIMRVFNLPPHIAPPPIVPAGKGEKK